MLHALLRRKLKASTPDPQRLEDAVTSTVFGTLVLVGAWDLLGKWLLAESSGLPTTTLNDPQLECWFWPRLSDAEPDVLLRLRDVLVIVEAKYQSGRHDKSTDGDSRDDGDQLVRQYNSVARNAGRLYAEPIRRAITETRSIVLAYVVDARRYRRARGEFDESKRKLPDAHLRLVRWQGLSRLLTEKEKLGFRWATDLRAYLTLQGLDGFEGIKLFKPPSLGSIPQWRPLRRVGGFREVVLAAPGEGVALLRLWRRSTRPSLAFRDLMGERSGSARPRMILGWRSSNGKRDSNE